MAQTKAAATAVIKRNPRTLAGDVPVPVDDARSNALALYEAALRLMQAGKYEAAHTKFNQLLDASPGDLADRIRMYINACMMQVSKGKTDFKSHEERYDYAISLLNTGQYEDAREELKTILADNSNADYAFYGLAVLSSMTGDSHTCLEHLSEAIRLNARNRIQARSDSDFQDMADDPRFTELLYPEV
ncbi:MAG TPA: tetratricopeptide repeat protein [Granulicella sp.]|nr:tetratricopeptide repeat protein [Granulicella sp.]